MKRVPGLDGLRAVSILLVLYGHLGGTLSLYNKAAVWGHFGQIAFLGVRVFFVISGYIITLLLLRETEKTGTISLKQFYFRRTLRIFPASYCFILFIALAHRFGVFQLNRGDLLHAVTYTINYFPLQRSWWVGHLWSLSVEEQFYLLWPATLLLLGTRKGLKAALAVVLLAPLVRLGTYYFWISQLGTIDKSFQTIADPIATGCLLAGYKDDLLARPWFRKIIDSRMFFVIPLAALVLGCMRSGARLRWLVLETLINLSIGLCVCRVTVHTKDWAGRLLNSAPFVFVGVLSYSLYLWQQLFSNDSSAWPDRLPQNLILAFCAALLCHYLIEKPFLRLRERKHRAAPASATAAATSN